MTLLHNGTSWLNMYQATVTACDELSSSRREEELAEAAKGSRNLEAAFEVSILRQAQEEVNMHGLNFKLSAQELMVPQLAGGRTRLALLHALPQGTHRRVA